MSQTGNPNPVAGVQRQQPWRVVIYAAMAAQVLLWMTIVIEIARHTNPKDGGMEWVALAHASAILALGVAPPFAFRREDKLLWVAALMVVAGVLLMAALLFETVRELG